MAERQLSKPEIAAQKKVVKLAPAIGDWTTYKPLKILVKKVKTGLYGFDRLSKDELNTMFTIHYRFIEKLMKNLRIDLGMAVELISVQVEQTTYLNFLRTLTGPMVQCKIKILGQHDQIFLLLDSHLANSIINYALGSVDLEVINRGLTDSEKEALATTLSEYLPTLSELFDKVIDDLSLSVVSSPDITLDSTINPSSPFASFIAETSLADNTPGKIYIAYPGNSLKSLIEKYHETEKSKALNFSRLPTALLSLISTRLSAVLGETLLTTNEISQLEVGDVVSIDTPISDAVPTSLGNIIKLLSQPGMKNQRRAIRLVGLKENQEVRVARPEISKPEPFPTPPPKPTQPAPKPIAPVPPPKPAPADDDFLDDFDDDFTDDDFGDDKL